MIKYPKLKQLKAELEKNPNLSVVPRETVEQLIKEFEIEDEIERFWRLSMIAWEKIEGKGGEDEPTKRNC